MIKTRAISTLSTTIMLLALSSLGMLVPCAAHAAHDGLLHVDGKTLFPIGFYNHPDDPKEVARMAAAGVNLIRCGNAAELDRAQAHDMYAWITLPMHRPLDDAGRERIASLGKHPALAVWEGPDELVWNFTAYSGLFRDGTHTVKDAWWAQTPEAVAHAQEQAAVIIPSIHDWATAIREIDGNKRPIWFNEAHQSDAIYIRQYMDVVDITGCDLYPVKAYERPLAKMRGATERYVRIGDGAPVWMVLQAFSWHEVRPEQDTEPGYPSFADSRFMAWDVIARGATGVLYWGSRYTENDAFLESIYAVTRELNTFQDFLTAPEIPDVSIRLLEHPPLEPQFGVAHVARMNKMDGLVVVINEDEHEHMGVEVRGLTPLAGRVLYQQYGEEVVEVKEGRILTRLQPYEVKVFSTIPANIPAPDAGRLFGKTAGK